MHAARGDSLACMRFDPAPTTPVAPAPTTAAPALGPDASVDEFVGTLLPSIPGLPGPSTPGIGLGDLVGPPAPGSARAKADMLAVKGAQLLRTPERDAWAVRMAEEGVTSLWFDLAKRHRAEVGTVAGWLDTALLASTMATNAAVTHVAKERYDRPRPFQVDPSIVPPVRLPRSSSYPSGHSSGAFAAARVIAAMSPSLAAEAYSLAAQVAASRVYAGVHFPSDVVAGALLGTGIAERVLRAANRSAAAVEPMPAAPRVAVA